MRTYVIQTRTFIISTLFGNWVISINIFAIFALVLDSNYAEKIIYILGFLIGGLLLWAQGGFTWYQKNMGSWRVFLLWHPPFLLVCLAEKVRHRVLEEQVILGALRYIFVDPIECEELQIKPWPYCLYKVRTPWF